MSVIANIKNLVLNFDDYKKRVGESALSRLEKEQKQRIFERGECKDGSKISSIRKARRRNQGEDYSVGHSKTRRRKGRQVDNVDLFLTGRHSQSLIVGEDSNGNPAYGFKDKRNREIAEGHTEYRRKDIYGSSNEELELVIKTVVAETRAILREIFNRA